MDTSPPAVNLYDLRYESLVSMLSKWGYGSYHANKIWRYLYVNMIESLDQMADLRADLFATLREQTWIGTPAVAASRRSDDGLTEKYLLALPDGEKIECVVMRYDGRITACISSQVGCAMGCVFCATGQMGFRRNLSSGEIIAQILFLMRRLEMEGERLRNVVFMGMGEPLHNYEATIDAIKIMTDDRGLAIGARYVTVSTVGLPHGIRRLVEEELPVNLAVSLHAVTDHERRDLVPVSDRWTLDELLESCRLYVEKRNRRVFFEWALIAGVNDSASQADALGRLLVGIDSHVNLIPVNPTYGFDKLPSGTETVKQFQRQLAQHGIPSTIRQRRGIDIQAGCGQLRSREERNSHPGS
jgi:23S rRNA (adenine2503-C2)-methyltransferase